MPKSVFPAAIIRNLPATSSKLPTEERRRDPRYLLRLALTMRGDNNFYSGLSEDLSEGGVFIATHKVLAIGTPVVLSFTVPEFDEPITVAGTVRWIRDAKAMASADNIFGGDQSLGQPLPGMGVQFHDVSEESAAIIRSFMRRRQPDFFDS